MPGALRRRRQLLRGGLALAGLSVLAGCGPLAPALQQATGPPRIGYLTSDRESSSDPFSDAFRRGLGELGYVEGENLAIEWRFAERSELLPSLAAELVGLPVTAIVAAGGQAVSAAKGATTTIPIIMPVSGDPIAQGFVTSLARPDTNITGLTTQSASPLAGKRLQLLKEIAPRISRVAVLWNADNPAKRIEYRETEAAAGPLGIELYSLAVRRPDELDGGFAGALSAQAEALDTLTDPLTTTLAVPIVDLASRHRLPSVFELRTFVTAGGLVAYGPDTTDMYRRAATYVDKVLRGAKPGDLPIEQPTRFDFAVNLKTAQTLGLTIPQTVLQQATDVIQ
jgi:putative tryptophan/tyrosine transport system substrate-binding protein